MISLFYDKHDLRHSKKLRDERFTWLTELGVTELSEAAADATGFLFGYEHGEEQYRSLVADRPNLRDRPDERRELVRLDHVLQRLAMQGVELPTPKTWILGIDDAPPHDLQFPVFVRTPKSSWKRGGSQSRASNLRQLSDEIELLRRAFGWDTTILARQWIDAAAAGKWMFGDAPQEIRVWIVDGAPVAWSFHYLHVVPTPAGFPPAAEDLSLLADLAAKIGAVFRSRLIAADFLRDRGGRWHFLEAGPGAASGTAHETVFKFVAEKLRNRQTVLHADAVGGPL
ncbi:MAG TPA: ATP-grasp domain-containing protein [Pirellulales bacterium]